jgi:hypothetical protein
MPKKTPTQNIEALSNFTQGRALFDSYLETGNWDDLSEAEECFKLSIAQDPNFDTARFYRAVSQIELGNTTEAIEELETLVPHFGVDAHVQLAQAYARKGE